MSAFRSSVLAFALLSAALVAQTPGVTPDWVMNIINQSGANGPIYAAEYGSFYAHSFAVDGIYVGGSFTMIGGVAANNIAHWNGTSWEPVGSGTTSPFGPAHPDAAVLTMCTFIDAPSGDEGIIIGGRFSSAGGAAETAHLAFLTRGTYRSLWGDTNGTVRSVHSRGIQEVVIGGEFTETGHAGARDPCDRVAYSTGSGWIGPATPLPANAVVHSVADGVFVSLHQALIGGENLGPNGECAVYMNWDGSLQDTGIARRNPAGPAVVLTIAAPPWGLIGTGLPAAFIVGGIFDTWAPTGEALGNIAIIGGPMDGGIHPIGVFDGAVRAIASYSDDAGGTAIVGGDFTHVDGQAIAHVARRFGTSWTDTAGGTDGPVERIFRTNDDQWIVTGPFAHAGTTNAGGFAVFAGNTPPSIRLSAVPARAIVGNDIDLFAAISGTGPLQVQWFRDQTPIPGATHPYHRLHDAGAADAGVYTMRLTGRLGQVTTDPGTLTMMNGLSAYGPKELNSDGTPFQLTASVEPRIGEASFGLQVTTDIAPDWGVCIIAGAPLDPPVMFGRFPCLVDILTAPPVLLPLPWQNGYSSTAVEIAIPNDPMLIGVEVYVQFVCVSAGYEQLLRVSNGIAVTILT